MSFRKNNSFTNLLLNIRLEKAAKNIAFNELVLTKKLIFPFIFQILIAQSIFAQNPGKELFEQNCGSCHNFKQDGIGPHLGGFQSKIPKTYMREVINSPKTMLANGNPRFVNIQKKFKTVMPDFKYLGAEKIDEIVEYIFEQPAPPVYSSKFGRSLPNPIPAKIMAYSKSVVLKELAVFPETNKTDPKTRITKMAQKPGTNESYVLDLQGQLYYLDETFQPKVAFDIAPFFPKFINKPGLAVGFGSFAFHPDFLKNGLFYTSHTEAAHSQVATFALPDSISSKMQWVLCEWKMDEPNAQSFSGKNRELLRVDVNGQIHGMQEIAFDPFAKKGSADYGLLYFGVGDGGAVENGYPQVALNPENIWGKVLCINPQGQNSKNGKYGVPAANPFIGKPGLDEAFASGFRNPNRIYWPSAGKMLVTNIGQHNIEALYWLQKGDNCGWPEREGAFMVDYKTDVNFVYPLKETKAKFNYPVLQYDHDEGNAILGGFEYKGKLLPQLYGKYIFGEIVQGRLFFADLKTMIKGKAGKITELKINIGSDNSLKKHLNIDKIDLRLGTDASGEIYLFTKPDGKMYQVIGFK